MNIQTAIVGKLSGKVCVTTVPADIAEDQVFAAAKIATPLFNRKNLIVNSAEDVIAGMFRRDYENYMPYYISIGSGGDLDQTTLLDTGERVAPALTDTKIRSLVYRIPIIQANTVSATSWTYVAVARPYEALTTSLNELTLETLNGTLISHYVEPALPGEVRAEKHVKSSLEYLVIQWTLTFNLN